MIMQICSIHDSKAEAWLTPMFFEATGQAVRSFRDAVADKSSQFGKHPEDYVLFALGTFDPRSGTIVLAVAPQSLATGVQVQPQAELELTQ